MASSTPPIVSVSMPPYGHAVVEVADDRRSSRFEVHVDQVLALADRVDSPRRSA